MTESVRIVVDALKEVAAKFGFAALMCCYFAFRDYMQNNRNIKALEEMNANFQLIFKKMGWTEE